MERTLYTRLEAGNYPVRVRTIGTKTTYTLECPSGPVTFTSARQLLIKLTGHAEARHWTLERYFRFGRYRYAHSPSTENSILEFFAPGAWATLPRGKTHKYKRATGHVTQTEIGIDLKARGKEVAKLLYSGFSGMIRSGHYDPEDVLQEVYKGILVRNQGTCPFDPAKASFGHYVHMVCSCVLSNYHRRHQRHSVEQVGILGFSEQGDLTSQSAEEDTSGKLVTPAWALSDRILYQDVVTSLKAHPQRELAVKMLPLLGEGMGRSEIAESLGESKANVAKAVALLRERFQYS